MLRHTCRTGLCILLGSYVFLAGGHSAASTPAGTPATQPRRMLCSLDIRVDPRVELMSIVCRLAGNPEYNRARINAYTRDVDEYFQPHRDHPAVKRLRELRSRCGVSFDAPMSLAVHLSDAQTLKLLVPLEPWPAGLDDRWRRANLDEFVEQLRDFQRQSKFSDFLDARQDLFDKAVAKAKAALAGQGHLEWFDEFFRQATPIRFHLILSILNGQNSYGVRQVSDRQEDAYSILGIWNTGNDGTPRFDNNTVWVLIHELGHSYVNPIVLRHAKEMQRVGTRIYELDPDRMKKQAYGGWAPVICESILRACVVQYLQANEGAATARKQKDYDVSRGFTWVPELADLLAEYEQQRDRYPRFEDFIPQIVTFFDEYTARTQTNQGSVQE